MTDYAHTPINGIEQAKAFFQAMGCSSFHMTREYPQRYEEYRKLGISQVTERDWTYQSLHEHVRSLCAPTTSPSELWRLHSAAERLVRNLLSKEAIESIYAATEAIVDRLPCESRLVVAETINGRGSLTQRSGLVFLAYDLVDRDLADRFSQISLVLIHSAKAAGADPKRCERALDVCKRIRLLLEL